MWFDLVNAPEIPADLRISAISLARYKLPEDWRFVAAMPMTASGKVQKSAMAGVFAS